MVNLRIMWSDSRTNAYLSSSFTISLTVCSLLCRPIKVILKPNMELLQPIINQMCGALDGLQADYLNAGECLQPWCMTVHCSDADICTLCVLMLHWAAASVTMCNSSATKLVIGMCNIVWLSCDEACVRHVDEWKSNHWSWFLISDVQTYNHFSIKNIDWQPCYLWIELFWHYLKFMYNVN